MSFIKTTIAAAALTLVAVSANAQTTRDYLFHEWTAAPTVEASTQARKAFASQNIRTSGTERAPFSREANERFTW